MGVQVPPPAPLSRPAGARANDQLDQPDLPTMQVTELTNDALKRAYKIAVPAATLSGQVDTRLTEMAKTAVMPGFRRGKVPVTLLRKQYGQALFGEAVEKAVNDS